MNLTTIVMFSVNIKKEEETQYKKWEEKGREEKKMNTKVKEQEREARTGIKLNEKLKNGKEKKANKT